jgi:hypothetical protein
LPQCLEPTRNGEAEEEEEDDGDGDELKVLSNIRL